MAIRPEWAHRGQVGRSALRCGCILRVVYRGTRYEHTAVEASGPDPIGLCIPSWVTPYSRDHLLAAHSDVYNPLPRLTSKVLIGEAFAAVIDRNAAATLVENVMMRTVGEVPRDQCGSDGR